MKINRNKQKRIPGTSGFKLMIITHMNKNVKVVYKHMYFIIWQ
jgi:hypothetical protein